MITIQELQHVLADAFLGSDLELAGIGMYIVMMAGIFAVFGRKSLIAPFALMLPTTYAFTVMGIMSEGLTILLIIVAVVGLAMAVRDRV